MQFQYRQIVSGWSFCREILHGTQTSTCYNKWIPRSFPHLLLEIAIPTMLIWISCVVFVKIRDSSGFAFRRFSVNHLNKVLNLFLDRVKHLIQTYVSWVGSVITGVVGAISRSEKNWNKSHINMLNNNGPSMDPCGTLKIISDNKLYVPLNFNLCFRLVKWECNSFKEGITP